ncbi:hypothetical protein [Amycolatopsis rubida]|uniref:Uncharacterized protein n=1 Tax=Amycolatopsis rubida TaxID=112413 RepID=A0A1I5XBB2_9PSEU|nr:hypothetical protein [Amycolatopsis rubida]SFQ29255.1 hypothetical protein SAMN05421854_110137 [Amycolatopsis rubida]
MTSLSRQPPPTELVPRRVAIRAYGDGTRHAYDAARLAWIKIDLTIRPLCHLRGGGPVLHYFDRINAVPQENLDYRGCSRCAAVLATGFHEVIVGVLIALALAEGDVVRTAGRLPVDDVPSGSEPGTLESVPDTAQLALPTRTSPSEPADPGPRATPPARAADAEPREPALAGASP